MADFYQIDFLPVGNTTSGDAICLRYEIGGQSHIHVVDGGYEENGQQVLGHLTEYYGSTGIDHVVVTHPDGDHAVGLRTVLEEAQVNALWINRPWMYAEELLPHFARYTNVENLAKALRDVFPNLAKLEDIANERGIPMYEAFQGQKIGVFTVLAPSRDAFFGYVVEDEKTPKAAPETAAKGGLLDVAVRALTEGVRLVQATWGAEKFPTDDTSPRNNMSIVQHANLGGEHVVLTADSGRAGLGEAADYAPFLGLSLPAKEIRLMQVPHHGSRHNVSTEILDRWLGEVGNENQENRSNAVISAGENDEDHPRQVVVRAFMHRGAVVAQTKGSRLCFSGGEAPSRPGWTSVTPVPYPTGYEE